MEIVGGQDKNTHSTKRRLSGAPDAQLYWYDAAGQVLAETDSRGNAVDNYVYCNGVSIAKLHIEPGPTYYSYYVRDHLGTTRMITDQAGNVCYDADYFPWGQEQHVFVNSCPQNYKFSGKERDIESGNDYFGARYYSSSMGRFLSPDWSAKEEPVPYAKLDNPQTLNLYDYMRNNPLGGIDTDGHDVVLLNDSHAAAGQGHNATIVGNDKGGWAYYSRNGYGRDDQPIHFGTLSDFQKSDASGRYDRGTRFSTNSDQDKAMNKVGTDEIKKPYDVTERGNHQNCADLSADVMKAGGLNTDKPKEVTTPEVSTPAIQTPLGTIPSVTIPSVQIPAPITNPNQQYSNTVKNNNGTTVQPHCTGQNCHQ